MTSPAALAEARLRIGGMTCAACALRVEQALSRIEGVRDAQVNLASELATVHFNAEQLTTDALAQAVDEAGYDASPLKDAAPEQERVAWEGTVETELRRQGLWVGVSAALTAPLVVPMLLGWITAGWMLPAALQFALASAVQFGPGARFYRGAFQSLRSASANMDVLVALGTSAAYGLSLFEWSEGRHLYFEASASVITLVLFGKWLESNAKRQTRLALSRLARLRPQSARRLTADGTEDVPTERIATGDVLLIRAGEQVPVDGQILSGTSSVDESLVTGESLPIAKEPGDLVTGGCVNGTGVLRIVATTVGGESTLSRIILAVEQAQGSKPDIVRAVDRVTAVFVPTVLALSVFTLLGWLALGAPLDRAVLTAVAVLVIACPCALGLATPAALMVGTGVAARRGILIRDLQVLEQASAIDVAVFDKTGTLTQGKPQLTAVLPRGEHRTEAELLTLAAGLQLQSEHPLAEALVRAAEARGLTLPPVEETEVLLGRGLRGRIGGRTLILGSARLMRESEVDLSPLTSECQRAEAEGAAVTFLAEQALRAEGQPQLLGAFVTRDVLRRTSAAAIQLLAHSGIRSVLLTGDRRPTAEAIARQAGIEEVIAEVLPDQKSDHIRLLQAQGHRVLMVGDGVNDAPALAAADLSVAMGTGTDVAVSTASISLLRPELPLVSEALAIAIATRRKIHQNLFWAFGYNALGIPLAMAGRLSPTVAGAAMALSSVSVLLSALSLRWTRLTLPLRRIPPHEDLSDRQHDLRGLHSGSKEVRRTSAGP